MAQLSLRERVEGWNATFPAYPPLSYWRNNQREWIYGVWYCGTTYRRAQIYGQYPPSYLQRVLALFPDATRILHCPSGLVRGPGVTVDINPTYAPAVVADAKHLPFTDATFDLILADPPYTTADAKHYGCGPYPLTRAFNEAGRVLRCGGFYVMLHTHYPSYSRKQGWMLVGLIAVVVGFAKRTRISSIFTKGEPT